MSRQSLLFVALAAALGAGTAFLLLRDGPGNVPAVEPATDAAPAADGGAGLAARGPLPPADESDLPLPPGRGRLPGIVVDEKGVPVAGVPVLAVVEPEDVDELRAMFRRERPRRASALTRTGADGKFLIAGVAQRQYRVFARPSPPAYGTTASAGPTADSAPIRLRVLPGVAVTGRVEHATGTAASGVLVDASADDWSAETMVTTDAGSFVLPAAPPGSLTFRARAGRVSRVDAVVRPTAGEPVVLRLLEAPGAVVWGTVTDVDGAPIEGARILFEVRHPEREAEGGLVLAVETGDDGGYRAEWLPTGRLTRILAAARGRRNYEPSRISVPVDPKTPTRIDIVLQRGAAVRGRVRDAASGDGLPLARVRITREVDEGWTEVRTSEAGTFVFDGLETGKASVSVRADGFDSEPKSIDLVASEAPMDLDLELRRLPRRGGVVLDESGRPAAGVAVEVWKAGGATPAGSLIVLDDIWIADAGFVLGGPAAVSGEDGRFEVASDAIAAGALVVARRDREVSAATPWPGPAKDGEEAAAVELRLRRGAVVRGKVVDPLDSGVPGTSVSTEPFERGATSDASGAFEIGPLPAGRYVLFLPDRGAIDLTCCSFISISEEEAVGNVPTRTRLEPVAVDLGWGAEAEVTLRAANPVVPAVPRETIEGVVLRPGGAGAGGEGVELKRGQFVERQAWTDRTGRFVFEGVPAGLSGLTLVLDEKVVRENVRAGERGITLAAPVRERRAIEGDVVGPDGAPVAYARVHVGGAEPSEPGIVGGRWSATVPALYATVEIRVSAAADASGTSLGTLPWRRRVAVNGERVVTRLERGRVVVGRVVGDAGAGIAGCTVRAHVGAAAPELGLEESEELEETRADAAGAFRLVGVPPCDVVIRAVDPTKEWSAEAETRVGPTETEVVVRMARQGELAGRVLDPGGGPLAGAEVRCRAAEPHMPWVDENAVSGADGSFRVRGLPPSGSVTLTATGGGPRAETWVGAKAEAVEVGRRDVTLRLESGVFVSGELRTADGVPVRIGRLHFTPAGGGERVLATLDGLDHRFRAGPMRPGTYAVAYDDTPWYSAEREPVSPGTVAAPGTDLRLVAAVRAALRGRLLGTDVRGFRVAWIPGRSEENGSESAAAWTAADGSFSLDRQSSVNSGALYVSRAGDERCALVEGVAPGKSVDVSLVPGLVLEGRLARLPPGGAIGVTVHAQDRGVEASVPVQEDGRFRFTGLPAGKYVLRVWGGGLEFPDLGGIPAGRRDVVLDPDASPDDR